MHHISEERLEAQRMVYNHMISRIRSVTANIKAGDDSNLQEDLDAILDLVEGNSYVICAEDHKPQYETWLKVFDSHH